jgi:hypothetical protein
MPAETPSVLVNVVVEVLKAGPMDAFQLLAELRRRRSQAVRHIFDSEVEMAIEYLKSRGAVAEETIDRTALTIQALRARPWKSKHLGSCPAELEGSVVRRKGLVSLYAQKSSTWNQGLGSRRTQLGPIGTFCLNCQYCDIDL